VYGISAVSALQFSDEVFVINSFSKFFGMTGWRVGWLIVPELFIDAVEKLTQNIFISTATHSQFAALAAFGDETMNELEGRRQEFSQRRDFLYAELQQLGFKVAVKPQGAFYIYADCSMFTDDSFNFAKQLLEIQAVAITPGKDFGEHAAEQHVRFAYTTSLERLQEGVRRLKRFLG
jgi:aspartate/methionine/tyrosine aminotransferase